MIRIQCSTPCFVLCAALGNAFLFHGPLLRFTSENIDLLTTGGALIAATLFVLVFSTTAIVLAAGAIVHSVVPKVLCVLIVLGNAIALYFVQTYRVVLDKTMMGNVVNSDILEAATLFHPRLIVFLLVFAVLPMVILAMVSVRPSRFWSRVTLFVLLVLAGVSWIYANARTWLWFDRHLHTVGALIMPWSYVINTSRYWQQNHSPTVSPVLLPAAHRLNHDNPLVVLVIGEAARAANFSMYGYKRNTNPSLTQHSAVPLQNSTACATYTTAAITCMLSHNGSNATYADQFENLPSYLQRHNVDVTWRSNNTGHPEMTVRTFQKADELRASCLDLECNYDTALLHKLDVVLQSQTSEDDAQLVVLHQTGSHGPAYYKKYPERFNRYKPVCRSVDLQRCTPEQLFNAYDNTIVFTDYFLGRLISILKTDPDRPSVMIYVSDHGESLGESGLYLHGTPISMAPAVQKNIPFIVWMSETFQRQRNLRNHDLGGKTNYSHDNVFHSVMGALGLRSDVYQPTHDIFAHGDQ